eukprot:356677-Heterocapsa_arctica.AAC.1
MESGHREGHTKNINNCNGDCLLCGEKNAGANNLWWDCVALNKHSNFGHLKLNQIRHREGNQS